MATSFCIFLGGKTCDVIHGFLSVFYRFKFSKASHFRYHLFVHINGAVCTIAAFRLFTFMYLSYAFGRPKMHPTSSMMNWSGCSVVIVGRSALFEAFRGHEVWVKRLLSLQVNYHVVRISYRIFFKVRFQTALLICDHIDLLRKLNVNNSAPAFFIRCLWLFVKVCKHLRLWHLVRPV